MFYEFQNVRRIGVEASSGPDAAAKKHHSNVFDGADWRIDRKSRL